MKLYEGIGSGTLWQRIRWLFTQKRFKLILTKDSVHIYEMGNLKWHKALLFYFHWYWWTRKSGCDVNMYNEGLYKSGRRGSIALARQLCLEIAGEPYPDDWEGSGYGSVDVAEILSAEIERLRNAIKKTLDENAHLADGEVCTLICLKVALRESGSPWYGDV